MGKKRGNDDIVVQRTCDEETRRRGFFYTIEESARASLSLAPLRDSQRLPSTPRVEYSRLKRVIHSINYLLLLFLIPRYFSFLFSSHLILLGGPRRLIHVYRRTSSPLCARVPLSTPDALLLSCEAQSILQCTTAAAPRTIKRRFANIILSHLPFNSFILFI